MADLIEIDDEAINLGGKPREEGDLDITPMIDITFLLLIFFIVTSTMNSQAIQTMPKAISGAQVSASDSAVLTVTKSSTPNRATVYLGDGTDPGLAADESSWVRQEDAISDYVAAALTGRLPDSNIPKQYVLIKAEGGIPYGEIERISLAVTRGGGGDAIQTIYIGIEDKQ